VGAEAEAGAKAGAGAGAEATRDHSTPAPESEPDAATEPESAGLLVVNVVGTHTGRHSVTPSAICRTLRQTFRHVRAFRDRPLDSAPASPTNLVFFASDAPVEFDGSSSSSSSRRSSSSVGGGAVVEARYGQVRRKFLEWEVTGLLGSATAAADGDTGAGAGSDPGAEWVVRSSRGSVARDHLTDPRAEDVEEAVPAAAVALVEGAKLYVRDAMRAHVDAMVPHMEELLTTAVAQHWRAG
jgi:hypothetical protein